MYVKLGISQVSDTSCFFLYSCKLYVCTYVFINSFGPAISDDIKLNHV